MPSLELFGQRTPFAGDDLRYFSVVISLFRLLQLGLALALFGYTTNQKKHNEDLHFALNTCEENGEFTNLANHGLIISYCYDVVAIALSLVGLIAVVPMFFISGKGTPTDPEPRKALFFLCYLNLSVVNVFRILGFLFGALTVVVVQDYCECLSDELVYVQDVQSLRDACPESGLWLGVTITLVVTHAIDFIAAVGVFFYFFISASTQNVTPLVSSESQWKVCLRCCIGFSSSLTCCIFGGAQAIGGDIGDFAMVMANYFNSNQILDVTPTDVVAGLVMLRRVQQQELLATRERLQREVSRESLLNDKETTRISKKIDVQEGNAREHMKTRRAMSLPRMPSKGETALEITPGGIEAPGGKEALSPRHPRELYLVAEGARFMPMAQAMYTWVSFLLEHQISGLFRLGYRILRRCARFSNSSDDTIYGDFFWKPHTVALQAISGLHEDDIVYASFKQSITKTPYMIALDHEWKSVVISIRGTLSMESLLADMTLRPEELDKLGEECGFDGKDRYCHAGMLACTEWIYRDMKR
jgi:hypothetical protein